MESCLCVLHVADHSDGGEEEDSEQDNTVGQGVSRDVLDCWGCHSKTPRPEWLEHHNAISHSSAD